MGKAEDRKLRKKRLKKRREIRRLKAKEKWNSMSKSRKTWSIIVIILSVLFIVCGIVLSVVWRFKYHDVKLASIGLCIVSIGLFLSIVPAIIRGQKFVYYIQAGWGQVAFVLGGILLIFCLFELFVWYIALILLIACAFIPEILREKR